MAAQKLVLRKEYLNKLKKFKDHDLIKVVTGIRRSGKSTLLTQYRTWLLSQGVRSEQMITIDLEDLEFEELEDYHLLYQYVKEHLIPGCKSYLFIDEIQNVDQFEKAINSLYLNKDIDIYLTGSNSKVLSGELATLISGRYIEIQILPLSLSEFSELKEENPNQVWPVYRIEGGLPYLAQVEGKQERLDYLEGIYNTVLIKDIMERKQLQNLNLFTRITQFLIDNIGNPVNPLKITNTLNSNQEKTTRPTVVKYLEGLKESFIFYEVPRFDIKGKELLKTNSKYYLSDIGFRQLITRNERRDAGHILENLVFLELLRRGYKISIGILPKAEIDFVAEKGSSRIYVQVSLSVNEEQTFKREISAFRELSDGYPRVLITLDDWTQDVDGIRHLNAVSFLSGAALD